MNNNQFSNNMQLNSKRDNSPKPIRTRNNNILPRSRRTRQISPQVRSIRQNQAVRQQSPRRNTRQTSSSREISSPRNTRQALPLRALSRSRNTRRVQSVRESIEPIQTGDRQDLEQFSDMSDEEAWKRIKKLALEIKKMDINSPRRHQLLDEFDKLQRDFPQPFGQMTRRPMQLYDKMRY